MTTRHLIHLAEKLRLEHALTQSWPKAAAACNVLTPGCKPNPKLAEMIAQGYDPRRPETRARLGLPPVCPCCSRRMTAHRENPAWLEQAVKGLRALEQNRPTQPVGFTRQGRAVRPESLANVLFSELREKQEAQN